MIGLDTNVLVRYFAQDHPIQSHKATQLIERQLTIEEPGFVSVVAMTETVWVLERAYDLTGRELASVIERMLQSEVLVIEHEQEVFTAVMLRQSRGEFADALIAALCVRAGCQVTLTFDRKALRLPGFRLA